MADLPDIETVDRNPVHIEVPAHWADHRFMGKAVLPAVEAMQLLAFWTARLRPGTDCRCIGEARFDKFLELPPAGEVIAAFCDLADLPDGAVQAALVTRRKAGSAAITRTITHARLVFEPLRPLGAQTPLDMSAALAGPCFRVAPQPLYEHLVPFGAGYRNISRPLLLTREGALAVIRAPEVIDRQTDRPLGSPFAADAALHAACVWGQRFTGRVAFPVGIDERRIVNPTRCGETYIGRVFPVRTEQQGVLVFDILILDPNGGLCEQINGVRMRDVSGGRLKPPEWIATGLAEPLSATGCLAMALIERDTLMPFADQCLSPRERQRIEHLGPGRSEAFLAARLACKRLFRTICGNDRSTPADEIDTLAADGIRPSLPPAAGKPPADCCVAHDGRFALAAAAGPSIGVDVEKTNGRLCDSLHLFLSQDEQALVRIAPLEPAAAAVRAWSIKESVAKALNITMAEAWPRTEVIRIGVEESGLRIDSGWPLKAYHYAVDDHVVTWVAIR